MPRHIFRLSLFVVLLALGGSIRAKEVVFMGMCAPSAQAFVEMVNVGGAYIGRYQRAGQLLTAGNAAGRKGDLTRARAFYEAAIRSEPTFWPAYYARGWLFLRQRQWNLAIQDANTVLHHDSTVVEAELL